MSSGACWLAFREGASRVVPTTLAKWPIKEMKSSRQKKRRLEGQPSSRTCTFLRFAPLRSASRFLSLLLSGVANHRTSSRAHISLPCAWAPHRGSHCTHHLPARRIPSRLSISLLWSGFGGSRMVERLGRRFLAWFLFVEFYWLLFNWSRMHCNLHDVAEFAL